MKDTITNAAEITVLQPIDNNYKTGGGDISVGGACVVASKGKPLTPIAIYGDSTDLEDAFGLPLPKKAYGMEGLRHVSDASEDCSYVNTVRVVNTLRYRFPSLSFLLTNLTNEEWEAGKEYKAGDVVVKGAKMWICAYDNTSTAENAPDATGQTDWLEYTGPAVKGAHRYNEAVAVGEGSYMVLYPIDGDTSVNRRVQITKVDSAKRRFTLVIYDKDAMGEDYLLEQHTVGVGEDDKDDMGMSAYIETVFERASKRFRVDYMEGITWDQVEGSLLSSETTRTVTHDFTFEGGESGGAPELTDWMLGVDVFRNERIACNLLFAAGIYEPDVIVQLADVADDRHIAFFYDVPPALTCEQAIDWIRSLGLKSRHARAYYAPYSANDMWRGGELVWGVSGAMAASKARCNKIVTVGAVPGVHYSPAGIKRGYLTRTGLKQLFPEDRINRDDLYDARINPILPSPTGGCVGDDDLVNWNETNYLRFGWINDVLDYIDHRFYEAAQMAKFEPDGLTRQILWDLTAEILDQLVTSGALVPPRDPARDGTKEWTLQIEQLEIDLWKVTWNICITGAARRIVGQPKLIR